MKTPRVMAAEARIAAAGRPHFFLDHPGRIDERLNAAREWDAANPEESKAYFDAVEELDAAKLEAEEAEKRRRNEENAVAWARRSGVGARSLDVALAAEETQAIAAVRKWLDDSSRSWLVMCGSKGTGKSVAATWAVVESWRRGRSAAFRAMTFVSKLSSFDEGADELERLINVRLLVLDDLGTEMLTDYAKAQLHELLDARHENYGRTILTSNLLWDAPGPGGLQERLGERLVDRVKQSGSVVQFKGQSLRKAAT